MKKYLKYIFVSLIFIITIIFMNTNEELYSNPILKIENVKLKSTTEQYNNNLTEKYYNETIIGKIINGKYKGKTITFENTRSYSGVYDNKYSKGDEVFIRLDEKGNLEEIINLRRDKHIVILFTLMICTLFLVGGYKGIFTLISLIINIVLILLVTYLRDKGANIFLLFIPLSLLMIGISLCLTSGINKKTLVAALSSAASLTITFTITFIIIKFFNNDIPYWYMDYIDVLYDYKEVFLASALISGLGAIMDVAISIVSTLNELIQNTPKISINSLKKSGKNLSEDIMGTMVNVLLFTSISSCIPIIIYVMRNNLSVTTAINMYAKIDLIRFMVGALGIFITVPISIYLSIYFFKRRAK